MFFKVERHIAMAMQTKNFFLKYFLLQLKDLGMMEASCRMGECSVRMSNLFTPAMVGFGYNKIMFIRTKMTAPISLRSVERECVGGRFKANK